MPGSGVGIRVDGEFRMHVRTVSLEEAAVAALAHERAEHPWDLTIVVSDDETLRELNHRHRGKDAATDVLAFPTEAQEEFVLPPGFPHYLGDVVISYPCALAQASEVGHSVQAELQLLVVHGVLHLLGHDDMIREQRDRMWVAQAEILSMLDIEAHLPE